MANPNQTDSTQSGSKQQSPNQGKDRPNQAGGSGQPGQGSGSRQGNNPNVTDPSRNKQRREQHVPSGADRMNADDSQQDDNQLEIRDDEENSDSQEADSTNVREAGEENPPNEEGNPNVSKNRRGQERPEQTRQ